MGLNDRSDCNPEDVDDKLKQYMLINRQISKTLTSQRVEIANLKKLLRTSTSEVIVVQMESHNWKKKFHAIRKLYIDHIQSITSELQTNADKINDLSSDIVDDTVNSNPLRRSGAGTTNTSKTADDSRRVSKSFESTKNRSERTNVNFIDMDTIDEESENENTQEVVPEKNEEASSREVTTESNEDESSREVTTESNEDETSREITTESGVNDSKSPSVDESVNSSQRDLIEQDSDSDSGDETFTDCGEEGDESEDSDDESGDSDEGSEKSEQSSKSGKEIAKEDQSGDISDTENKSDSVERISLLTTNYESTIKNDDSNKENDRYTTVDASNSTQSIDENSQTVISVDGQSFNKSTSRYLQNNKKVINISVKSSQPESINNQTFGSMKVNSLISSTPYRNNNNNNNNPVEISIPSPALSTRSRSNAIISMTSQVSITSGVTSNSTISASPTFSRPRRKASPSDLCEPKLNTKLRRPR